MGLPYITKVHNVDTSTIVTIIVIIVVLALCVGMPIAAIHGAKGRKLKQNRDEAYLASINNNRQNIDSSSTTIPSDLTDKKQVVSQVKLGGAIRVFIGVIVGFISLLFLDFIPIVGPILAGFIAGVIAGGGAGRGLSAGFLTGMLASLILAILISSGVGFVGKLLDLPVLGALLGGAAGTIVIILGLYNGFLGLIGGAIGGAIGK